MGGERKHRRLRDRASSRAMSGGVGGALGSRRGAAWYWGGGVLHPQWICRVGVRRRWRLVVRVGWLSRMGAGLGGSFGVHVVAGQIPFLVWMGRPLVVGGVVASSARWVVLHSYALDLLVQGGLWPGGVGRWAVVVVLVVVVVVVVLGVCPESPLALR